MLTNRFEIKQRIYELKSLLKTDNDPIKYLKDAYIGRTALVVSAGPSAKMWEEIHQQESSNNPVIVCVKQAKNLVGDLCDIHFLNNWNLRSYEYGDGCLSVMTEDNLVPCFGHYDIKFHIDRTLVTPDLATYKAFDSCTLEDSGMARPIGPGIMHETVIYMLLHMGVKRIVTIGWDIADNCGTNQHFDDIESKSVRKIHKGIEIPFKATCIRIYKYLMWLHKYLRYANGKVINHAGMKPGEAEKVSDSVRYLREWLHSQGVSLEIKGGSKWF